MNVYLAGPINGQTDSDAHDWREHVKKVLGEGFDYGFSFIDPMDRDYRGVEDHFYPVIVEKDKADIRRCNVLFAYCPQPSVGTSMEIFYAYSLSKRVVTVVPEGARVSPWLRVHSEIVLPDFEIATTYVKRLVA